MAFPFGKLLMPAWLFWGAVDPQSAGTLYGQIILGALVAANTYMLMKKAKDDLKLREQDRFDREQRRKHDDEDRRRIAEDHKAKVEQVEMEVKKNTAVTVAAAEHAGNGAAEAVQEIVREYDDLAERRRRERAENARLRSAAGAGRQDHEVGAGDAGRVLPPPPGQGERPAL